MANKTVVRIVAMVLALLMAMGLIVNAVGAMATATSSISSLKQQQQDLKNKKSSINQQIKDAENKQLNIIAKKKLLDEQMDVTQQEIDNTVALIDEYTQFIAQAEIEIADLQEQEKVQWQAYKTRVRVMEENGSISYVEVLLTATSFSDLLSRIDMISEIMERDKKLYNDLVETRETLQQRKTEKEEALVEQEEQKTQLESKKRELAKQQADAEALIKQYENEILKNEALIKEIDAENKRLEKEIEEAQKEQTPALGEKGFAWPARGGYVTSKFGPRKSPTAGASNFHGGIDIGGLGYGADVLASKSGTVTTSALSSSYGNYIIINHGDGTTTLYAHMQQRLVSKGATVKQGQVIGKVGSTGISTGPHIHFEIRVNGTRVDPQKYV